MTGITLPYHLQDGQKAYAARLMANLSAIADKLNQVQVPGLPEGDVETALQQLKLLLDQEYAADAKVVQSFSYDSASRQLKLQLANGAVFTVSAAPFISDYLGTEGQTVAVQVDAEHQISAEVQDHSIAAEKLTDGLRNQISGKVTADSPGNAEQILFSDGQSMQTKLDAGAFRGQDGVSVALSGLCYFRVDQSNGHLYVGVADGYPQPPFAIDQRGHLIYTIE